MKRILMMVLLLCLCVSAQAESYTYSNEKALNMYYECEDFDREIPAQLSGVFDSRIEHGDEILCGTLRTTKYHNEPGVIQKQNALLALKRDGKILLLSAVNMEGKWRCAVETDGFFGQGQRFDLTVLPQHNSEGSFRGASLAIVCGEEEFHLSTMKDGEVMLSQYRAPQTDGSMLEIDVYEGYLYASRYKEGVLQESKSANGVIPRRLCGWTYEDFPKSCAEVAEWENRDMPEFADDEAIIFGVNLRERPTGSSRSMGVYTAKVRVLDQAEGKQSPWYQVEFGGRTGWVSGTYLLIPGTPRGEFDIQMYLSETPRFARNEQPVALLSAPDGDALMELPAGTMMQIVSENDGWLHVARMQSDVPLIDWNGTFGFIRVQDVITGVSPADVQYR